MTIPTIHINGTKREDLLGAIVNAAVKVNEAIAALREASPNGRDYYPQGSSVIYQAISEHSDRVGKLTSVYAELLELHNAIEAGGYKR